MEIIKINGLDFKYISMRIDKSYDHEAILLTILGEYNPAHNIMNIVYKGDVFHGEKVLVYYDASKDITKFLIWIDKIII